MKKFTKTLLIALALVLVFATTVLSVSAAEKTVAVASSDFLVRQGETFTTTIYIPDNAQGFPFLYILASTCYFGHFQNISKYKISGA